MVRVSAAGCREISSSCCRRHTKVGTTACCSTCWVCFAGAWWDLYLVLEAALASIFVHIVDVLHGANSTACWYKCDTGRECRGYGGVVTWSGFSRYRSELWRLMPLARFM
ncbi:uncharacterized protein BDZ99DRAFT_26695 [Mytilinidion resinicola]|uniref:Uncharacterized protein n=1 Tax=Mytilinidion resinicola TaxID=574789 RepID=A0A6A6YN70_9PEZI|nr:uncharacterized protein BDZ99DRAFT_26695 [Mytilinidion resinicola]KAF2809317.1 hypothetical protein BDZ99DRAFT_26695 [Mytilinidion resinicola]